MHASPTSPAHGRPKEAVRRSGSAAPRTTAEVAFRSSENSRPGSPNGVPAGVLGAAAVPNCRSCNALRAPRREEGPPGPHP